VITVLVTSFGKEGKLSEPTGFGMSTDLPPEPLSDIRSVLADRLIRLDGRLRAAGKIHGGRNPPEMLVSVAEADALRATAIEENGEPLDKLSFIGVELKVIEGPADCA
jgi:hypothetical protein